MTADSPAHADVPEGYEYLEVSAAKDAVMAILEEHHDLDEEEFDYIGLADSIVNDLMTKDILIPEWFPTLDGEPANGKVPTEDELDAWRNRGRQ